MNASIIADYADVLAAIGVISSLLFVAFQVRLNTNAVRNQQWLSTIDRVAENFSRPLDERVATTLDKGKKNFNELSDPEKETFNAWALEYIIGVNRNITFGRQGLLHPEIAAMWMRDLKWFFNYPGAGQWWRNADRHPVPAHFEAIIDRALSEMGSAAA